MNKTKKKNISKKAIFAATAASMLFTGCGCLDDVLNPHDPADDHPIQASSSSNHVPSSSSFAGPHDLFETWYGYNGEPQIQTGFGNFTETNGYWYPRDDHDEGGRSEIIWPVPMGNEYSDVAMDPIIEYCGGLCGAYSLKKGTLTYNPFVGVGFNLVGERSDSDLTPEAADATSMGGVCVTYASEMALSLEMGLTEAAEAEIGYAVPYVNLPKSPYGTTKYISWSEFKQPSWYKGFVKMSGDKAAQQLVSLNFKFQGANGTLGRFNITAVGPYDGCQASQLPVYLPEMGNPNPVDTIIPIDPPTLTSNNFETWFGYTGEAQINTGYDNGTETSGYWFSYSDDADGGASTIRWPVTPGNDYSPDAMDPIIAECNGLCGTAILDAGSLTYHPFVGVGFALAGETIDGGELETVNASGMGGVCITYTSEVAPSLEMSLGEKNDADIGFAYPAAMLPKSSAGTTKFIPWSSFKQPSWYKGDVKFTGEQAAKTLAALKFKMQAHPGSYRFNIQAIGPYDGTCSGAPSVTINKKRH